MSATKPNVPPQCPKCLKLIDHPGEVVAGNLLACISCVSPLIVNDDLTVRAVEPDEVDDAMMIKLVKQMLEPESLARILTRSREKKKKQESTAIAININRSGSVKIKLANADAFEVSASVAHQIGTAICEAAFHAAEVDAE